MNIFYFFDLKFVYIHVAICVIHQIRILYLNDWGQNIKNLEFRPQNLVSTNDRTQSKNKLKLQKKVFSLNIEMFFF